MPLQSDLEAGGRKYAVVIRTLELGFLLGLIGLLVAVLKPDIAPHVAAIVSTFGLLGSASIVSYQGANAAADWKRVPSAKVAEVVAEPKADAAAQSSEFSTAPRQSGTVLVGDA